MRYKVLLLGIMAWGAMILLTLGAQTNDFTQLLERAKGGDAEAQADVGKCYALGEGVTTNYAESFRWYSLSAGQGNAEGQNGVGIRYLNGQGVAQDYGKALEMFNLASAQSNASAYCDIGFMYEHGLGVESNAVKAVKYYNASSLLGDLYGQFNLGLMYFNGNGVEEDEQEGVKWFLASAEQGNSNAQSMTGWLYFDGYDLGAATNSILGWLCEAAEKDDADALYLLGRMYANGKAVEQNDEKAFRYYKRAAETGQVLGQLHLARAYESGSGTATNKNEAIKWYEKAAEQDSSDALYALGLYYKSGEILEQDITKAAHFIQKACELSIWENRFIVLGDDFQFQARWADAVKGDREAQNLLGRFYAEGKGVSASSAKSIEWYRKAANNGQPDAQFTLGLAYSNGDGVYENKKEAAKWYLKSAYQGHEGAQCNIGVLYQSGRGVIEDYIEAYAWYTLASMNGSKVGGDNKDRLKTEMYAAQIAAGQERAKELQALIDRKKAITESDSDKSLGSDIAPSGFGSGLMVSGGYVLTCWHVVDGAERISISLNGKDHVASIVQKDAANDIAVLKVAGIPGGVVLNLADDAKLGEKVFTLGYPHPDLQGLDVKFTTGSISSLTGIDNSPRYFQISAPLQSGNSGGPLFDEKGNLVGIVAAKLDSIATLALTGDLPQNVNYAIKADYLEPLLKTVQELEVGKEQTKEVNLLELIEELKKSVVMIKVY